MYRAIVFGTKNGKDYFLKLCSNFLHQENCTCKYIANNLTRTRAELKACELSSILNIPIKEEKLIL